MKKWRTVLLGMIVLLLSAAVCSYAADPITGQWSAMGSDCYIEISFHADKTANLWAGCWQSAYECFAVGSFPVNWSRVDTGVYYATWSNDADMFFVKGTTATNYKNTTWLKMPLKQVKNNIISNACYALQQASLRYTPEYKNVLQLMGGFSVLK